MFVKSSKCDTSMIALKHRGQREESFCHVSKTFIFYFKNIWIFTSIENGAKGKCAVIALWVTLGGWGWPNCSWGLPTDGPSSNKAVFRIIQYSRGHRTRKIPYALDCVWVGVMPMVPCAIGDEDQHSIQTGNPEEGSGRSFPTIVKG